MQTLSHGKLVLLKITKREALKRLEGASSPEEDTLAIYGELPAARKATIKAKVAAIKTEFTTLRQAINGASTLAALKTVWKDWILAETNPDPDPEINRNRFRRALGRDHKIDEQ